MPNFSPALCGAAVYLREAAVNLDAVLRPVDAAAVAGVSKQLLNWWRRAGKLACDEQGRYRLGDVLAVERDTRRSPHSRRAA